MVSIWLIICMMMSSFASLAGADQTTGPVEVGVAEGAKGDTVQVAVYVTPEDMVWKYDITIEYDPAVLELVLGNEVTDELGVSGLETFQSSMPSAGKIQVTAVLLTHVLLGKEKVFTLHFKIKSDATPGLSVVTAVTGQSFLYEGDDPIAPSSIVAGGVTVSAPSAPTVTFDPQGGSMGTSVIQAVYGATVDAPVAPTKNGYSFVGWYKEAAGTNPWSFTADLVTANITLYAKWALHTVAIGAGTSGGLPGVTVQVPVTVTSTTYSVGSYQMEIHFDASALEVTGISGEAGDYFDSNFDNANGWLRAAWADSDGGETPVAAGDKLFTISFLIKQTASAGDKALTIPTPGNLQYFSVTDPSMVEMDKSFTDGKVTVAQTFAVTFDSQGGNAVSGVSGLTTGSLIQTPAAPAKDGHSFVGWYKESAGTNPWSFATDQVTGNITLYAKWALHTVAIGAGSTTGLPGASVQVPVTVTSTTYSVGSYQMEIHFDAAALEVTGITGNAGDYFDSNYDNANGWLRAAWADSDGGETPLVGGDKLFTIDFLIKSTAAAGDKPLTIPNSSSVQKYSVTDPSMTEMDKSFADGKVTVVQAYTVTFDSQGGSEVTAVGSVATGSLLHAPTAPTMSGYTFVGWYKEEAGTTPWNFAVDTVTADITLYAKWSEIDNTPPSEPENNGNTPPTSPPVKSGVDVLVNGKPESAGTAETKEVNGQKVTTILVDEEKLQQRLEAAGDRATITIPVTTSSDVVIGELNGRMVKSMEAKHAVVEIRTEQASYTLPAQLIDIDAVSERFGVSLELKDVKIRIEIAAPSTETVSSVKQAAEANGLAIVVPPLNFTVTAVYGDRTEVISKFNAYVERTIAIPDGVDPSRITTGVVMEPDGTVRHVPTQVVQIDGKYYAKINSLTNSTYSVVWHPLQFGDVSAHWAKDAVNEMGSRLVVDGTGDGKFSPDQAITRAEFAAIIVRGLGLRLESGPSKFSDVGASDWYGKAIYTASEYRLINGFEDGTYRPNETITREQATVILSRAMTITKLQGITTGQSAAEIVASFADFDRVSDWALAGIADSVKAGIISGRDDSLLAPGAHMTRAEVATTMQRLLQKSNLINVR